MSSSTSVAAILSLLIFTSFLSEVDMLLKNGEKGQYVRFGRNASKKMSGRGRGAMASNGGQPEFVTRNSESW